MAFLDNIIKKHPDLNQFNGVTVSIPRTVVLCTDIFDEFMDKEHNDAQTEALQTAENIVYQRVEAAAQITAQKEKHQRRRDGVVQQVGFGFRQKLRIQRQQDGEGYREQHHVQQQHKFQL